MEAGVHNAVTPIWPQFVMRATLMSYTLYSGDALVLHELVFITATHQAFQLACGGSNERNKLDEIYEK